MMTEWTNNLGNIDLDREIAQWFHEHPEIAPIIRAAVITGAISIIIATIIEDFATLGIGVADDWASFLVAWRLVRIAML